MSEILLEAHGLTRRFGGVTAVDGVDLEVAVGELHCIIGPNGAGKSTLFNMLCGTLRPTAGRIRFAGQEIVGLPVHRFARIGIARKFQVPSVFASMSVRDNLLVAVPPGVPVTDFSRRLDEVLERIALAPLADHQAGTLAHGQKQWLEIGMALMCAPRLLLLDEPTAGMTAEETHATAALLRSLRGRLTTIAIEHDMRFVRDLDCHTMVMHQGRLIAAGRFVEIERDELVRDIYLGRR